MSTTTTSPRTKDFVFYSEAVELKRADEDHVFEQDRRDHAEDLGKVDHGARNAYRSVHAKSHGLLKGELRVLDHLPEPYAQGLFARPAEYGIVMRFSTNPGDILPDSISTPRGLAVKVIGIDGLAMVPNTG